MKFFLLFPLLASVPAFAAPLQWMAPANAHVWTLRLEGAAPEYLLYDGETPVVRGGKELTFNAGRLEGTEHATGTVVRAIGDFWQERVIWDETRMPRIWSGGNRLALWFENPNVTGAFLLPFCLLATWLLLFGRSRIWTVHGALLSASSFLLLLQTASRGAFLGWLVGGGILLGIKFARTGLKLKVVLPVLLTLAGLIGVLFASGQHERMTKRLFERSKTNAPRFELAMGGLQMAHDNPFGWKGLCPSETSCGYAYSEWYKPTDVFKGWKALLNSHLQIYVYHGVIIKFLYLFTWIFGLGWLFAARKVLPAVVFIGLGVSACFNATFEDWSVWILPLLIFAVSVLRRPYPHARTVAWIGGASAALAVLVGAALYFVGGALPRAEESAFKAVGPRLFFNAERSEDVRSWVVDDDIVLSGGFPGFTGGEIREAYAANENLQPLGYVRELEDVPPESVRIVVTGRKCRELIDLFRAGNLPSGFSIGRKELVFLSPSFSWREMPADFVERFHPVMVVGEFVALVTGDRRDHPKWVRIVRGTELYIPGWMRFCVN